jgi:hypothetical protein
MSLERLEWFRMSKPQPRVKLDPNQLWSMLDRGKAVLSLSGCADAVLCERWARESRRFRSCRLVEMVS